MKIQIAKKGVDVSLEDEDIDDMLCNCVYKWEINGDISIDGNLLSFDAKIELSEVYGSENNNGEIRSFIESETYTIDEVFIRDEYEEEMSFDDLCISETDVLEFSEWCIVNREKL